MQAIKSNQLQSNQLNHANQQNKQKPKQIITKTNQQTKAKSIEHKTKAKQQTPTPTNQTTSKRITTYTNSTNTHGN